MRDATRTTTALLDGLFDPTNAIVWSAFDRRYRPLLFGLARRLGVGETDAADVAQETIAKFAAEYRAGHYDRSRGRLRSWLLSFVRVRVLELRRRRARHPDERGGADAHDIDVTDDQTLDDAWQTERRLLLLAEALDELRTATRTDPKTIRAFELLYVHGLTPAATASEIGISVDEVYVARSRVASRVREIVRRLDEQWDD